jgi:VWFA-related protein
LKFSRKAALGFTPMIYRLTMCALVLTLAVTQTRPSRAQQPNPTHPGSNSQSNPAGQSEQNAVKITIEEVQIPVAAYDPFGHLDPTLDLNDILILENGTRQEIRSARRVPASVLLLLDTGGEINPTKNIRVTSAIAKNLVNTLAPKDQIAVIQFNSKVELLQDWTTDPAQVAQVLNTKLLSGKRAHLSAAISSAVDQFRSQPVGNRHLVLITDGVETPDARQNRAEAIKSLMASNAVVHVISYTVVSLAPTKQTRRISSKRDKSTTPDVVIESLPPDHGFGGKPYGGYDQLRHLHKPGGRAFDLDPERRRRIKEYEEAMRQSELELASLAKETGGNIWLPESLEQMIDAGAETAHLIDAEYVVTYRPSPPLASAREGDVRHIEVVSRRVGLHIVSRRSYVVVGSH